VNLLAQMKGKPSKSAVVVLALVFFFWMLAYPDPLAKMLMGSKLVLPASVYWLLRLEVALLALFLASRWERIQENIHYALSWANSVGMMRYGIACIAAAFVITAWSLGDFPNMIFGGASPNYWFNIYLYIQLYAFFGFAAAGVCLVVMVNLIEIRYDFDDENKNFLHPFKFIDAKVEEWKREPQNNLLNTDDFSDLRVTSWNIKADEKTIEYELARRLLREKDGVTEAGKLGKWVLYKVVMDFKGRIRGIQRYEADDYQKIRYT